ncbi:FMN-dependent alpha-hydroxy acid dehydrogenase [Mycena indigotica]|uniref:FMN-dependent alpha-hydroxy acid dehydrogenase n=1 Tax=Mycena indigotica TaxID=2126181 RepID=A0A8H6TD63_9AGAR|nr:FMN-dependent alpha-hydroxy acid dehydrogenase [Mycena indigotica]KAF7315518.1 FMN-dependent alpha-hydroxy acid dehydrogenase [Mycena indigotica]
MHPLLLLFTANVALGVTLDTEGLPDTGLDTSGWTKGALPPLADMFDLNDMQLAAKNVLPAKYYASYRTGALNEYTYRANLEVYAKVRLNGFSFRDVSNVSTSALLGQQSWATPFRSRSSSRRPRRQVTRTRPPKRPSRAAAGSAGILYVPSISSTLPIEAIAAAGRAGQVMFHQMYVWANHSRVVDELARIEAAGFKALFVTVDNTGIAGVRTRSMRYTPGSDTGHAANFDLHALAAFRNLTTLPIVPKGIKTWQDARTCLRLGFRAVYVSNHGGRVLDGAPTAVEVLVDIQKHAPEVFAGMEVYADGGVRRGTDALILLALGARAVGLGRPPMFANVWGEAGVSRMAALLARELGTSMQLMGVRDVRELNGSYVNTNAVGY